jgi:type IV secretion system protein VirB3
MFSGLLFGALIFSAQEVRAAGFGIALWFGALFALRLAGEGRSRLRHVHLRHRRYKPYYPARSTPFRQQRRAREAIQMIKQSQLPLLCSVPSVAHALCRHLGVDAELKLGSIAQACRPGRSAQLRRRGR